MCGNYDLSDILALAKELDEGSHDPVLYEFLNISDCRYCDVNVFISPNCYFIFEILYPTDYVEKVYFTFDEVWKNFKGD